MGFGSLIDRLGWDFGPMVVSWLWWWLVEFWADNVYGCSGFQCVGFGSLIDWLGWDFGPVVVSWLRQWLVEFWAGNVCG